MMREREREREGERERERKKERERETKEIPDVTTLFGEDEDISSVNLDLVSYCERRWTPPSNTAFSWGSVEKGK